MLLKLDGISKSFRKSATGRPVLDGLDLEINYGQIVSLTGRSGCGKTTLLNIIAGLIPPDRGSMELYDHEIRCYWDFAASRRRNRQVGLIHQTFQILPSETVMWNVLLPARIRGTISRETRAYADELLGRLRMYSLRDQLAGTLSGGQKQRVAIARALINKPSLILADEPTANLDRRTAEEIYDILRSIREEGRSVLLVTHWEHMRAFSDEVYEMDKGRVKKI